MGMKKKAAMKAMKVMKKKAAMKAMKAMKKKSVSKIARGQMAKAMVLRGSKEKTVGGLTAKDLTKNVRQDCQQEEVCLCQEVSMDPGRRQGTQGIEDHWLRRRQEGHSSVCKGQGVLQPVSAALSHMRVFR